MISYGESGWCLIITRKIKYAVDIRNTTETSPMKNFSYISVCIKISSMYSSSLSDIKSRGVVDSTTVELEADSSLVGSKVLESFANRCLTSPCFSTARIVRISGKVFAHDDEKYATHAKIIVGIPHIFIFNKIKVLNGCVS